MEKKDTDRFPRGGDMDDKIFALRAENLSNFIGADVIRQFNDPAQSPGKRRALKRAHKSEHGIALSLTAIIANLRRCEDDTGRHCDRIDQIRDGGYVHV